MVMNHGMWEFLRTKKSIILVEFPCHEIVILVVIFALVSCDSNQLFDSYKTIPSKWDKNDSVVFSFKNFLSKI